MKTLPLSEAKAKLSALVESVLSSDEEIIITRNGSPAAVMISPDEYASWKETFTVMSDGELMEEIKKGLIQLKKKKARLYTLEEL